MLPGYRNASSAAFWGAMAACERASRPGVGIDSSSETPGDYELTPALHSDGDGSQFSVNWALSCREAGLARRWAC